MSDALKSTAGGCGSGNCACKTQAQAQRSTQARSPFDDTDYGTPLRHADIDVTLEIDGQAVTVPAGTSVMRAAIEAGVNVPKLCATDSLEPFGSCRLCLVEIEGKRGYPASCTTPVEAGMKVRTQTDRLQSLRRNVMELYISDHPLDCLTCPANGDCELQDMAGVTGLREVRYGFDGANHLKDKKDESNPYFSYDPSKCIVCNRCVRACEETQGTFALTIAGHGKDYYIAAAYPSAFAVGAVALERMVLGWVRAAYVVAIVAIAAVLTPTVLPYLDPDAVRGYFVALHAPVPQEERANLGTLPQYFADQFGWPELAAAVAKVYADLPPADRAKAYVLGGDYGQAAAVDVYDAGLGLPPALSGQNQYGFWGPRGYDGSVLIHIGGTLKGDSRECRSATLAATFSARYIMPYENALGIVICRGLRMPVA